MLILDLDLIYLKNNYVLMTNKINGRPSIISVVLQKSI